jgi:hypothetical protein
MDPDLWARFKSRAALERKTIGVLLAEILTDWLDRNYPASQQG